MTQSQLYGGVLTVDLDALASNFKLLQAAARSAECGATVKADAYGLGLEPVAKRLAREGCRRFFVATLGEGVTLRAWLPDASIYVFDGVEAGGEAEFVRHQLVPVLNSLPQMQRWSVHAQRVQSRLRCALHIDTGMNRLGMSEQEVAVLERAPWYFDGIALDHVMTHLACADQPQHPLNAQQIELFDRLRARLPAAPTSIGNSAATLMGGAYCGDIVRPGIALYGGRAHEGKANPMQTVVRLAAKILQIREVTPGTTVGYGATYKVQKASRIATIAVGYADGFLRALSVATGEAGPVGYVGDYPVPIVGRVSMDFITADVTSVPPELARRGAWVEVMGHRVTVDDLTDRAGTIGYELLTRLGQRVFRVYEGA